MMSSASLELTAGAERTALIADEGTWTYGQLRAAAGHVSRHLRDGRPDLEEARVAFACAPSLAYVAIMRGVWQAGGIAVPLAISHPAAELEYVIRDADAAIVIADGPRAAALAPIAASVGARFLLVDDLLPPGTDWTAAREGDGPRIAAGRRALVVYTSGTTGKPKGAVTTHEQFGAQVQSLLTAWEWSAADRTLLVLPLHHIHGILNVLNCALAAGAVCEILPSFDAARVWARLASGDLTVFSAVPTIYHRLIQSWEDAPETERARRTAGAAGLRLMMCGSAALPVTMLERWRQVSGHTLLERYGMTELGMALANPLHGTRRPGSVGLPLPGVVVRVVDEEGTDVVAGAPGELEVRGPSVFLEYWRRPDETSRAFRDGWFRTGDVAVLEDGAYRLLGRTSVDIIKTGGYKVSALEIEEVLRSHPDVNDCAVIGLSDPVWGERVVAAVEFSDGAAPPEDSLLPWAKGQLAPYKVPREIRPVAGLPRNAMGKVVKPAVAALWDESTR